MVNHMEISVGNSLYKTVGIFVDQWELGLEYGMYPMRY